MFSHGAIATATINPIQFISCDKQIGVAMLTCQEPFNNRRDRLTYVFRHLSAVDSSDSAMSPLVYIFLMNRNSYSGVSPNHNIQSSREVLNCTKGLRGMVGRSNYPNNFSLFTFVFLQVLLRTKDHYFCLMLWLI